MCEFAYEPIFSRCTFKMSEYDLGGSGPGVEFGTITEWSLNFDANGGVVGLVTEHDYHAAHGVSREGPREEKMRFEGIMKIFLGENP